jgi:broad specificity phosphatase PhoE
MSHVIFIRHGESLGNVDGYYYTLPDVANILSSKGVDQCVELNKTFKDQLEHDFYKTETTVIHSRYQRAKITAQIVTHKSGIIIHSEDARINEQGHDIYGVASESEESVKTRVRSIIEQYPFNLVLFTHGMLMGVIDPERGGARNCELRKYSREEILALLA